MTYRRKQQFEQRRTLILQTAEQLLLESGEYDLKLDDLAHRLGLAKGTLYKHFGSKDELLVWILIEYERQKSANHAINDGLSAGVARMVLEQLQAPQKTVMAAFLEEKLTATVVGLNPLFNELYQARHQNATRRLQLAEAYLKDQDSQMSAVDYLSAIWAMAHGGAVLLNSSFYQRFVGDREQLKFSLVYQALMLPKLQQAPQKPEIAPEPTPKEPIIPKLIRPLTPPMV